MNNSMHLPGTLTRNGQKVTRLSTCFAGAIALWVGIASDLQAKGFADFLFIVDESGSMAGEHAWLRGMVDDLEASLQSKGLGVGSEGNRYGLIGFGGNFYSGSPFARPIDFDLTRPGVQQFGDASAFVNATSQLRVSGNYEDGYQAIDYGLSNYQFRDKAAVNLVLVTDEDRDSNRLGSRPYNFASILENLKRNNVLLNTVVNARFVDGNNRAAIGVNADKEAFIADGAGGFTRSAGGRARQNNATTQDYVELAWATQTRNGKASGAAWDLEILRRGGNSAKSFTSAFVEIKALEALGQIEEPPEEPPTSVPEPSTLLGLLGLSAVGFGTLRQRRV